MEPRKCVVWLLLLAMATPALPAERTLLQQARKIKSGSPVRIELKTHKVVEGRLGEVTETQLRLQPFNPGSVPVSSYDLQDIAKIRSTERKPKRAWVKALEAPVVIPLEVLVTTLLLAACAATAAFDQGCLE